MYEEIRTDMRDCYTERLFVRRRFERTSGFTKFGFKTINRNQEHLGKRGSHFRMGESSSSRPETGNHSRNTVRLILTALRAVSLAEFVRKL
jgi:hypothetical protein